MLAVEILMGHGYRGLGVQNFLKYGFWTLTGSHFSMPFRYFPWSLLCSEYRPAPEPDGVFRKDRLKAVLQTEHRKNVIS